MTFVAIVCAVAAGTTGNPIYLMIGFALFFVDFFFL